MSPASPTDAAQREEREGRPRLRRRTRDRDKFDDLRLLLPKLEMNTILDIGANVGRTVAQFREHYPEARIWAAEPVEASYKALVESISDSTQVSCFNVAFGAREADGFITAEGTRPQNKLVPEGGRNTAPVHITTGEIFCATHQIDHINFLKIDTEGFDLDVLRGFQSFLGSHRIDLVQVEAGMTVRNHKHIPFDRFKGYLEPMGYFLFRIYEQSGWRKSGGPELGFTNPVFASEEVIEAHME